MSDGRADGRTGGRKAGWGSALLLGLAACSQIPMGARSPAPEQILLRAEAGTPAARFAGPLVFADGDSVVMTDMREGRRVTIRSGPGVILEVYRGQRSSSGAVAKGMGRGALFGLIVGVAAGLAGAGVSEILGGDTGDLSDWLVGSATSGVVTGAAGGAIAGAKEGEPVWERVTVPQLRQQLCKCPNPDPPRVAPAERLIPAG